MPEDTDGAEYGHFGGPRVSMRDPLAPPPSRPVPAATAREYPELAAAMVTDNVRVGPAPVASQ